MAIDPAEGGLDVRPQRGDEVSVAGAFVVGAREEHEQWRGIQATVVTPERRFPQRCHLAAADLVQDLARFCVLFRAQPCRLG